MARTCRLCGHKEDCARDLIDTRVYVPRYGHTKPFAPVHVECFLAHGGDLAQLTDSQLWHVSTRTWQHFGYLPGDTSSSSLRAAWGGAPVTGGGGVSGNGTEAHDMSERDARGPEEHERHGVPRSRLPASRGPHPCRVPRSLSPSRADRGARSALRRAA